MTTPPGNPPPYGQPYPYGQQQPSYPPPPPSSYPPPYSQQPPQPQYSQQPPGYYPPPPPKRSNKTLWWVLGGIGTFVVLAIIGAIVLFAVIGSDRVTATDIAKGDCLAEIPDSSRVLTVKTIDCAESHAGEVFAVLTMPDGEFPGQSAIDDYADRCSPALASYAPIAMIDDSIELYVLYPTKETWEQGDRAVTCVATLDPPRAGSIKG